MRTKIDSSPEEVLKALRTQKKITDTRSYDIYCSCGKWNREKMEGLPHGQILVETGLLKCSDRDEQLKYREKPTTSYIR